MRDVAVTSGTAEQDELEDSGSDDNWEAGSIEDSDQSDRSELSMQRPVRKKRKASKHPGTEGEGSADVKSAKKKGKAREKEKRKEKKKEKEQETVEQEETEEKTEEKTGMVEKTAEKDTPESEG
jgi:hypothetical protein